MDYEKLAAAYEQMKRLVLPQKKIVVTESLPYEPTWDACNITTRMRVQIPSGEICHMLEMGDTIFISEDVLKGIPISNNTDKPVHIGAGIPLYYEPKK